MHKSYVVCVLIFSTLCGVHAALAQVGPAYPTRTTSQVKGAGAAPRDHLPTTVLSTNATGGVAFNFPWDGYEPSHHTSCVAGQEFAFDGYCFRIDGDVDAYVLAMTNANIKVTAVLAYPPAWATNGCSGALMCAPNPALAQDFGRFAGAIASRFNGANGVGRISDFVIWNEINANAYFDIGCAAGEGTVCNVSTWMSQYATLFAWAYDYVQWSQSEARVMISLTDNFFGADVNNGTTADLTIQTVVPQFASLVAPRKWYPALHWSPINNLAGDPTFGVEDYGKVTPGSIGQVVGWLRKTFTSTPSAWEVQLTEGGITASLSPTPAAGETAQAQWLCTAFSNVLGTPGITQYIYTPLTTTDTFTRMELIECSLDANHECNPLGTYRYKPNWQTWSLANKAGSLNCGFESLPYVKLTRWGHPGRGHWVSTRMPPSGFSFENSWKILREPAAGTHLLYECLAPGTGGLTTHSLVSTAAHCEGLYSLGPLGYAYDSPAAGRIPLYRCTNSLSYATHFVSNDPNCEGSTFEGLLGYGIP